ncbi:MAG: hypothetical protein V4548_00635 [Bacteroidota bacterium]
MNDAHLHMLVNHFPIIGSIFGLGILITGLVLRNDILKNTAYVLFIIAAVFGFLSMNTGEGAEELVEEMETVGHHIIHEHEEIAEKFILVMYATGIFSILSLIASIKKHKLAKVSAIITLILAIVAVVLAKNVGTTGGEVRHTEIREIENKTSEHSEE